MVFVSKQTDTQPHPNKHTQPLFYIKIGDPNETILVWENNFE